jgi:hypothetical protein
MRRGNLLSGVEKQEEEGYYQRQQKLKHSTYGQMGRPVVLFSARKAKALMLGKYHK